MKEYKVRRIDRQGTGDIERICNDLAAKGWRLVSTNVTQASVLETSVFMFFERTAP